MLLFKNMGEKTYKDVRIVKAKQGWYIQWYELNPETKEWNRCRWKGGLNDSKLRPLQRERLAQNKLSAVIEALEEGKRMFREKRSNKLKKPFQNDSLLEAIDKVVTEKKEYLAINSIKSYNTLESYVKRYLEKYRISKIKLKEVNGELIKDFNQYLLQSGLSNRSVNNSFSTLRTIINEIDTRNNTIWKRNPAQGIKLLPTVTKKHTAYSRTQMKEVKAACFKLEEHQLWLFIQFIYYTLARPSTEIQNMKIEQIELENDRIFIPAADSKNRRDDYVDIYPPLKQTILDSGIMDFPKHYYIYGKDGIPAERHVEDKYFYRRNMKILKEIKLFKSKKRYDIYGYKHTGAIALYEESGKKIEVVQKQCRHKKASQTWEYLRDLGVDRTTYHFQNIKEI